MAMELIETIEVTSSVATVTFSNIPQTYTDLLVLVSARTDRSAVTNTLVIYPNGSTTNSTSIGLIAADTAPLSFSYSYNVIYTTAASSTSNTFGNGEVLFSNYTSSANKSSSATSVRENNASGNFMGISGSVWANTDPITSLVFDPDEGAFNIVAGSTFSLYGIS